MKQLFVHRPLFRILSPLLSGTLVYLLILLVNNNVMALEQQFLGQELYFCIGLAYLIQETSRLSILAFSKSHRIAPSLLGILVPTLISSLLTVFLVTASMYAYYEMMLGFSPIMTELITFNLIFLVITWVYLILFISYDLLKKSHESYLQQEEELKQHVQKDFVDFKQGINPELLFESLEQLVILSKLDAEKAEEFLDQFSTVYRYVLSKKKELVDIKSELDALMHLVNLLDELPNRTIELSIELSSSFLVVPGAILKIVEQMVRGAIVNETNMISLQLFEVDDSVVIKAEMIDKLMDEDSAYNAFNQLNRTYSLYTDKPLSKTKESHRTTVTIPKLTLAR